MFRIFVIGLAICQASAVLNNGNNNNNKAEAQRREAPADSYGPPPLPLDIPAPVYGIPSGPVARYPPPPPDVPPPPPSSSYGVPIQKYGPPKVHLEYGPPRPHYNPKPVYGPPPPQHHHQHHHHHQAQHEVSFLDQLKSTFGFGEPSHPPPQQQRRPHYHPKPNYGPPATPLLPPIKNFGNFASGSSSGAFSSSAGFSSSGSSSGISGHVAPIPTYGPPPHLGPHFNPDIRCDGWKPIPGPAIQPNTGYGVPPSGSAYHGNVEIGQQVIESGHIESANHVGADSNQGIVFDLPKPDSVQPFLVESSSFSHGSLHSGGKSNSFEISSNGLAETYGPPAPVTSYGPPAPVAPLPTSYGLPSLPKSPNAYLPPPPPKQHLELPTAGLIPPSGVYGVPPGGSYSSLAISHGSVSGSLKPWPVSGTAPIRPVLHRQPVPQGLIESIGHKHHHESSGSFGGNFRHQQQQHSYAPILDIQTPHGLNSLPLENSARPFLTQHNIGPIIHEARGVINDCGHGPSNLHLQQQFHVGQPIQDSYGPPPSGNIFTSQAATFGNLEGHANFITPAISSSFDLPAGHVPHVEYGVPKFNGQFDGHQDNFAFGSSLKSETVRITGEKVNVQPKDNSISTSGQEKQQDQKAASESATNQVQSQQQAIQIVHPQQAQGGDSQFDDEAARLDVAGLTGLNVLSAQKSQSITIPVEGARGNYELQFQSTDQTGAGSAPHEQLLSEGLLQQILSAIEQPNGQSEAHLVVDQTPKNAPQVTKEPQNDHDDVKIFLKSPEADPIINEAPAV